MRARIRDLGSSAILAFDGDRHIGQLQFRRYKAGARSPNGVWDPLWWMDFGNHAPHLPSATLCVFCCHVGQLDDSADRDESYQGRAIGTRLLDEFLDWVGAAGFGAVIAKGTARLRPISGFVGGLPCAVYETRGFEKVDGWIDTDLVRVIRDRGLAVESELGAAGRVACCVRLTA